MWVVGYAPLALTHPTGLVPWHFLYFFPLPHGHGSFRPTFDAVSADRDMGTAGVFGQISITASI
jgi:hypothetical protein